MECKVQYLEPKEFYEPGQKMRAEVLLTVLKAEKINSKAYRKIFH